MGLRWDPPLPSHSFNINEELGLTEHAHCTCSHAPSQPPASKCKESVCAFRDRPTMLGLYWVDRT